VAVRQGGKAVMVLAGEGARKKPVHHEEEVAGRKEEAVRRRNVRMTTGHAFPITRDPSCVRGVHYHRCRLHTLICHCHQLR
jgi:hypothetical protein